ncbi:MAG: hypothetical protein LBI03_04420, partial [Clostridiales bacterium]|nr:hypothetical protein [Clostridiales bacterium]
EAEKRTTDELIKDGILPDIPSLYQDGSNTALLISHAHQDHYGLMSHINPSCPVWLGFATQLLIELTNSFTGKEWTVQNAHHFKHDKKFTIGDIEITPYLMDHAAFDAYAFLIRSKTDGKSLFYSGDFRMHGRRANQFDWFCSHFKESVDYLLLEGSTIDRSKKPFKTESELEEDFVQTFKKTKGINLVYVSGQNIDRLETIYKACKRTGKIFLIDFYVANILKTLNKKADTTIPCPSRETFPEIKVFYPSSLTRRMIDKDAETVYPFRIHKIGKDKLEEMTDKLVMVVRPSVQRDLERYLHKYDDGCFIYSMWDGYKDKPGTTKDFLDFIASKGMPIEDIHTSGHADLSGLKMMADVVKPKHLVPIHTFKREEYPQLFDGFDVVIVDDKQEISI